jgi:hypothetical protein
VDAIDGHSYSHFMIQYWNSFTCVLISIITGLLLLRLKRTLEDRKRMNIDLRQALEELKRSTEEIRKIAKRIADRLCLDEADHSRGLLDDAGRAFEHSTSS